MIEVLERRRRASVNDDWPTCDYCVQPFSVGFTFYVDGDHAFCHLNVCDSCLAKAKKEGRLTHNGGPNENGN